ncbi:ClbS/DfsB family four-helix bundle protein [Demequina sp. NBRC 110056]|uniref:ClbS/DfsB family four-helix bundle protein n=1 Tax=Demequina sp. NBRC 110056 TaxID=1570345 RepID=UPI0013565AE2|nr:ClbS/DfsB family four-helix bundle protein [Demequina sp. NBRC 110056]
MTPTTADALIADADEQLAALLHHADALPDHAVAPEWTGERVADVLVHLHGWHELLLSWIADEAAGVEPAFPAPGYTWDRLAELNADILSQHAHRPYAEVRALLTASHARAVAAVRDLDDGTLFDASAHAWAGEQSLGDVAHECLGAHYRWGESVLAACAAP